MARQLVLGNIVFDESINDIIEKLSKEVNNGKLSYVRDRGTYITVTCPYHKEGLEKKPSCSVYTGDGDLEYGHFHCLTCGESGNFQKFVGYCLNADEPAGKRWLTSRIQFHRLSTQMNLGAIVLNKPKPKPPLAEDILNSFIPYHPYMSERKISDEVIKKFELKYDKNTGCIVFPVRNKYGNLSYLTRRSVSEKKFIIEKDSEKEVYLLYHVIRDNLKEVYITESQINQLVCESYGKNQVATFGSGCPQYQIDDLNNTDVVHYIIAFDPDPAGLKGTQKLCNRLKNKFVSVMVMPEGKDIGDLTKEEFDQCIILDKDEFLNNIPDYYKV